MNITNQEPENHIMPWHQGVNGTEAFPIIDTDDDIIRVEAGPGTGKTFALVKRVQRILHPDGLNVQGEKVLIVAFNRVIAQQLQHDIDTCLENSPHTGKPVISTIHSLCLKIMGDDTRLILPHEREAMIYDILHENANIASKYSKRGAEQALRDHEAKHKSDEELWQAVRQWLLRHKAELISELPQLLSNRLHGGDFGDLDYQHIIVDEFQDLTSGEQNLFMELRRDGTKFLAMGDPRQSIYAFRGNEREGLGKLEKLCKPTDSPITTINMQSCQRCPQDIVAAANQLMVLNKQLAMIPVKNVAANFHHVVWKSLKAESQGMAKAIAESLERWPQDKHLIMVTRREFGYELRKYLKEQNPTLIIDLSFDESLLETWPVREAFLFFCLVTDPDAATWRAWLGYQNSTDGKKYKASQRNADSYLRIFGESQDNLTEEIILKIANAETKPDGTGGTNIWRRAKRYAEQKAALKTDVSPEEMIAQIFNIEMWPCVGADNQETISLDMELAHDKALDILKIEKEKNSEFSDSQLLAEVTKRFRYQIATREPTVSSEEADIQITTIWGAKGVTADHVYVIGLCRQAMPGTKRDEYPGTDAEFMNEQRRLFYVSLTRSKFTLVMSRARYINTNEAKRLGLSVQFNKNYQAEMEMCPFIHEIITFLPKAKPGVDWTGCVV